MSETHLRDPEVKFPGRHCTRREFTHNGVVVTELVLSPYAGRCGAVYWVRFPMHLPVLDGGLNPFFSQTFGGSTGNASTEDLARRSVRERFESHYAGDWKRWGSDGLGLGVVTPTDEPDVRPCAVVDHQPEGTS